MPHVNVKTEVESNHGWEFEVEITDRDDLYQYTVTLNWSDYDLWSRGQVSPEKIVYAVFAFLLDNEPASMIMSKFDCAITRRYFPEIDQQISKYINQE